MPKIRGRIIRILDRHTVIVDLGARHGISNSSIFRILGEPEAIVHPFSEEELGRVTIVKATVKAKEVRENYTIATSKWTKTTYTARAYQSLLGGIDAADIMGMEERVEEIDQELNVDEEDIEPWKAKSEQPIKVGDAVEVTVSEEEAEPPPETTNTPY